MLPAYFELQDVVSHQCHPIPLVELILSPALDPAHQQRTVVLLATEVVVHQLPLQHFRRGGLVRIIPTPAVQLIHSRDTAGVVLPRRDAGDQLKDLILATRFLLRFVIYHRRDVTFAEFIGADALKFNFKQ